MVLFGIKLNDGELSCKYKNLIAVNALREIKISFFRVIILNSKKSMQVEMMDTPYLLTASCMNNLLGGNAVQYQRYNPYITAYQYQQK